MIKFLALAPLMFASSPSATLPFEQKVIPADFRGTWTLRAGECDWDNSLMQLTARKIILFEGRGKVTRVKVIDSGTIAVTAGMSFSGSPEVGQTLVISLSPDKQTLITGEHSDMSTYKRCGK